MSQRKTIAAALAAFLLLPLILSCGLQLFQVYLKHRALHRLENEILVNISYPSKDVEWIEENREVRIHGKMFDLTTWLDDHGTFRAKGAWDEKETRVMQWLNHFNEQQQNNFIARLLLIGQCLFLLTVIGIPGIFMAFINRQYQLFLIRLPLPRKRKILQPPWPAFS